MKTFEAEFLFNFLFLPLIIKNTIYFETKIEIKDSNCSTFSKEIELLSLIIYYEVRGRKKNNFDVFL